ncbi:hypothetical protein IFM89_016054 [Coptis chinensis]|uniref:Tr-type G domain-containing protein n=1 Tax=Coptis chinensis TaxID=261450 RepID=A0A835HK24_9MAGN|nr:hypothetical protein IFM89_016054 [Coptis chinensis]
MGRKKPNNNNNNNVDENNPQTGGGNTNKSKKKNRVIEDDEYMIPTDEEQVVPTPQVPVAEATDNKKKSKSSKKTSAFSFDALDNNEEEENNSGVVVEDNDDNVNEEGSVVSFTDKKVSKSKNNNGVVSGSSFSAIGDDDDDVPVISFTGKKKSSKKGSTSFSAFEGLDEVNDESKEEGEEDDVPVINFTGKKKSSKASKKGGSSFSAALLEEVDDVVQNDDASVSNDGKEEDDEVPEIMFSGKKKKSKKGSSVLAASGFGNEVSDVTELDQPTAGASRNETDGNNEKDAKVSNQGGKEVVETSKNKKKKKKSGRTAQEEDDLDKILAELGEGPSVAKPSVPPPEEESAQVQPEPVGSTEIADEKKEAEAETGESAAAKKKKKKKEKEKEKKAAAAAAVEVKEEKQEVKSKISDKKIPKHVREMQEQLARLKEAEERKKREEEEKLRREEEERLRQEELEKQAEEARRRKKEKEKEKLLRKKMEGKPLTAKQKEEARRREAMRSQFLANSDVLPTTEMSTATTRRPKYQTKKAKSVSAQANGAAPIKIEEETNQNKQDDVSDVDMLEVEKVEEIEATVRDGEKKPELELEDEKNGVEEEEEDDEDWDAKSWDDAALDLGVKSGFDEEEVEKEAEAEPVTVQVAKKEAKRITTPPPVDAGAPPTEFKPSTSTRKVAIPEPVKSQVEDKEDQKEFDAADTNTNTNNNKRKEAATKREARSKEAHRKRSADDLRSPICCIMGHVDTGKTKLLDCIRRTNVQEGEAGGITQQIGATYFPAENIRERTKELKADATLRVPGLLVIDTPGHESFTNLRSRGSGLCDIAILVVDIMHGLEPQTIESLNLLKMRNTEFIVALNKVDRLYGWKTCPNAPVVKAMKQQTMDVQNEFKMRLIQIVTQFKEQGMNTELYYKNKEMGETSSIVPTSAISGEGIPDLLLLLVQWTQKTMVEKLMFSNEVQCTVLEVKVIEGLGTTIDVVLVNGVLHEGDQVVVCGMQGPIVTTIRALLTPHPMKELRVKGSYLHHKEIKAAQGIKITAQGLEHAIAGTALYVVGPEDDLDDAKESAMQDMNSVGTPVCIPSRDYIDIGRIASIEVNHKQVDSAKKGQKVAIKIASTNAEEQQKMYGRHFEIDDELVSHITRSSIDVLKANYRVILKFIMQSYNVTDLPLKDKPSEFNWVSFFVIMVVLEGSNSLGKPEGCESNFDMSNKAESINEIDIEPSGPQLVCDILLCTKN